MEHWREAEEQAGDDGDRQREREHERIDDDVGGTRDAVRVRREQSAQTGTGEERADRCADDREHDAFGEKLLHHAAPARAERRPDGELLLARVGSREQEIGEVRARNDQHESDDALQNPDRRLHAADDVVLQRIDPKPMPGRVRHVGIRRDVLPVHELHLEVRPRQRERHARLEATDQIEKVAAAVSRIDGIQRERQPQLDLLIVHVVAARHDADDARLHAVDVEDRAERVLVRAERPLPQLVRENRDVFGVRQRVFAGEHPSADRLNAERRHQLVRDERGDGTARHVGAEIRCPNRVGADRVERPVALAELQEFWRGHPELIEPEPWKLAGDEHQTLRLRVPERPEHHAVDDAENRGVGADAERQRQYGEQRKAGILAEAAQRVAEVLEKGVHIDKD